MPAFVKTPAQEAKWKRAKDAVKRSRKKEQSDFSSTDWGLVTHIYQGIKKAQASGDYDLAKSSHQKLKEYIKGGKADGKPDSKYDPKELKMGMKVEAEHTKCPKRRKEIAKDHLEEFKWYYTFLKAMEGLMEFLKKKGSA